MQYVKQDAGYSSLAQILHWLIAAMIVVQYVLAELAEGADDAGRVVAQLALLANHKSVGMTVLLLAIIRLSELLVLRLDINALMLSWNFLNISSAFS